MILAEYLNINILASYMLVLFPLNALAEHLDLVGDINLKPEITNTLSATFDWHDVNEKLWQLTLADYYTYIQNCIGVTKI